MSHALLLGDPVEGYRYVGPFLSEDDAAAWGETHFPNETWWPVELENPIAADLAQLIERLPTVPGDEPEVVEVDGEEFVPVLVEDTVSNEGSVVLMRGTDPSGKSVTFACEPRAAMDIAHALERDEEPVAMVPTYMFWGAR